MNRFFQFFSFVIFLIWTSISFGQSLKDSIGNASFYADKFNGRKTANGEKFDNKQMTAAHRTLPFNTLVLVTNPKNGKEVVVKVNDRGPHVKNRIIDLSKNAAAQLDIVSAGVSKVHLKIIDSTYFTTKILDTLPSPILVKAIPTDSIVTLVEIEKKWFYGVQVASLKEMESIEKVRQTISQLTEENVYIFNYQKDDNILYQVVVGNFLSSQKATVLKKILKKKFKDAFITHYQN